MGDFLSQPNKEKHSQDSENSFVSVVQIMFLCLNNS